MNRDQQLNAERASYGDAPTVPYSEAAYYDTPTVSYSEAAYYDTPTAPSDQKSSSDHQSRPPVRRLKTLLDEMDEGDKRRPEGSSVYVTRRSLLSDRDREDSGENDGELSDGREEKEKSLGLALGVIIVVVMHMIAILFVFGCGPFSEYQEAGRTEGCNFFMSLFGASSALAVLLFWVGVCVHNCKEGG